jgi:hypothetical protein
MRRKALEIRGREQERRTVPTQPTLLPIEHVGAISWQGSAGANSYELQRATSPNGPWESVAGRVDDSVVQYVPLYGDASAEIGQTYSYRVLARNAEGKSPPSNVQSIRVVSQALVDECRDKSLLHAASELVEPTTGDDRKRFEDVHRLRMPPDSEVFYRAGGPIESVEIVVFVTDASLSMNLQCSSGVDAFTPIEASVEAFEESADDYGYLHRRILRATDLRNARLLKIVAGIDDTDADGLSNDGESPVAELSRVVIKYGAE